MSKADAGFTLVELMITVAVMAILIAIGFPSFSATMRSNRIATRANEFMASVSLARSEAIKNNIGAGICASATGTSCGVDWNAGWMVFSDTNGNNAFDAGEPVLRVSSGNANMSFTAAPAAAGTLAFNTRGIYTSAAAVPVNFTMQPSDCPTGYVGVRTFRLLTIGQLSMQKVACP